MVTKDLIGVQAARASVVSLREQCESLGLTLTKLVITLKEGLDAERVKTHYDTVLCEWKYSAPLVDHNIRLKAIDLVFKILDLYPSDKHKVYHHGPIDLEARLRRAFDGRDGKQESDSTVRPRLEKNKSSSGRE